MGQRRRMEFLIDYICEIKYHLGKANVVVDALSKKVSESSVKPRALLTHMTVTQVLLDRIKELQLGDPRLVQLKASGKLEVTVRENSMILFQGRYYVPDDLELKHEILNKAHKSKFFIHPRNTKMYQNLKRNYWWYDMKREIADYCCGFLGAIKRSEYIYSRK